MNAEVRAVVEYLERERGIERGVIFEAIESAMHSAHVKSISSCGEVRIEIDRETYDIRAFAERRVVERHFAEKDEISMDDAVKIKPDAQPGDVIEVEVTPRNFGRIAAQTAKQAIMQRIRQAEKSRIYDDYKDSSGEVVTGSVARFDRSDVYIDLGNAEAVMPSRERVPTEEYQIGDRIRALIVAVNNKASGPEIVLSRSHPEFVKRLFELEVSEISDGTVEIMGIAREAGYRTKFAVLSHDEKVDPVGACVGMRGMRVKNIVRELSGEKIDIVRWSDDIKTYVINALAPARLSKVDVDEETRTVSVIVDPDQLSLAIGKRGQNARLTAKLTGWRVDIQRDEDQISFEEKVALAISRLAAVEGVGEELAENLVQAGFLTMEGILAADTGDLAEVEGLDDEQAEKIRAAVEKAYEKEHGAMEL